MPEALFGAQPPAIGTTWPVTKPHSPMAKKAIRAPTSSGLPSRLVGEALILRHDARPVPGEAAHRRRSDIVQDIGDGDDATFRNPRTPASVIRHGACGEEISP